MNFEQPSNLGKTPNEIKKEVGEKGEKLLTLEEYEEFKKKEIEKQEEFIKKFNESQGLNNLYKIDRLTIKKYEDMTPAEKEELKKESLGYGVRVGVRLFND